MRRNNAARTLRRSLKSQELRDLLSEALAIAKKDGEIEAIERLVQLIEKKAAP